VEDAMMSARMAAALCVMALAGCASPVASPGSPATATGGPSAAPATVAPITPVPVSGATQGPGPTGLLRLDWSVVPEPDIRPKRGFEHNFLASERGAMILVRHLEGDSTTIVATTRDGVTWTTAEVASATQRFGYSVDGGPDWLQVVERADGQPGLELIASPDGLAWETLGQLPAAMQTAGDGIAKGDAIVVCGTGRGSFEGRASCAHSADGGRTWEGLDGLAAMIGMAQVRGIVPLGQGFVAIVKGEREGESVSLTSADGSSWTRQKELVPSGGTAVANVEGNLVVTGITDTGVSMAVSRDGVSWESVPVPHVDGWIHEFVKAGNALVAPVIWSQPEGGEQVSDFLVSSDGRTWRSDGLPPRMKDWQNMTFLPVEGGLVVMGGDPGTMMRGMVVAADDPVPTPVPTPGPTSVPTASPAASATLRSPPSSTT
jgi:hypothetical protein